MSSHLGPGTPRRSRTLILAADSVGPVASLALAGLNACRAAPSDEKIVPYVNQPEQIVPGRPLFFATAFPMRGVGAGVLVESHEGRPTKIEGNPNHPASLGATDAFAQASRDGEKPARAVERAFGVAHLRMARPVAGPHEARTRPLVRPSLRNPSASRAVAP